MSDQTAFCDTRIWSRRTQSLRLPRESVTARLRLLPFVAARDAHKTWSRSIGRTALVVTGRALAATVVFAIGFYGWASFESARHVQAETAVIAKYAKVFQACLASGTNPRRCPSTVFYQCENDPFWKTAAYAPWPMSSAPAPDRSTRCLIG